MQRIPRATVRWVLPTPGGPSSSTLAASGTKDSPASSRTWRSSIDGWKDEVEVLEGALKGEMRESRPGDQVPLPPGSHFDAEQVGKEVSVGQLALGRGLEPGFQHLSGLS